jgi:hypothetical protein
VPSDPEAHGVLADIYASHQAFSEAIPHYRAYLASHPTDGNEWTGLGIAGVPFLTSWYKGFREQNAFKRAYNSVMARGDRIIAVGDQIADLIIDRHGTPWERIAVIPASIDVAEFDPARVSPARVILTTPPRSRDFGV